MPPNSNEDTSPAPQPEEIAARCHEIQTGLGMIEVPEFEQLQRVGMGVKIALHIRGLPSVNYETLKLVASHYLGVPVSAVKSVLEMLADIEFVKLQTEGRTIKGLVPNVPYYETLYKALGTYAAGEGFNEAEALSIDLLCRLSRAPEKVDTLKAKIGADANLFKRVFEVGKQGSYVRVHRSRGRDVALSPTYFSENSDIYADLVAGSGSSQVKKLLTALQTIQGMPLSIIRKQKEIGGVTLSDQELNMLLRLAQDGAVKPPSISTAHAGEQFFLFTPTPGAAALAPTKREIYERAMAIVAAIRQGQFMAKHYAIRSPGAVLYTLKEKMKLGRATTEASQQYRKLVHLRIAQLIDIGNGFCELRIIDTPENREALSIAYNLVSAGVSSGTEVDQAAKDALQQEYAFVESLVASGTLQRRETVALTQQQQLELENLFYK